MKKNRNFRSLLIFLSGAGGLWILGGLSFFGFAWFYLPEPDLVELQADYVPTAAAAFDAPSIPVAAAALAAPVNNPDAVETDEEAANFLIQATFGPDIATIADLRQQGYSQWFRNQLAMSPDYYLDDVKRRIAGDPDRDSLKAERHSLESFLWKTKNRPQQLRMRAQFALSQILVTSTEPLEWRGKAEMHASYKDVLIKHSFGNYRDLLQDVTYNPLMGSWLTYANNARANLNTGAVPDQNYAREILQLFTLGPVQLNNDGAPKLNGSKPIASYDQKDVVELAKVFTGLHYNGQKFGERLSIEPEVASDTLPLVMDNRFHSEGAKYFLGKRVTDNRDGNRSISQALDILFDHPNVGPFISKQLIQRFTTSNPRADYIARVSNAFNNGVYILPDGTRVGSGERGDLVPVWAAILFDPDARGDARFAEGEAGAQWGKVREPAIRFVHWMRVADVSGFKVNEISNWDKLGQVPYRAPDGFNFYRPNYTVPGSATGQKGLVAPELQITTGPQLIDYFNVMRGFSFGVQIDENFIPQFARDIELADLPEAYLDYLDLVYTANQLTDNTRALILAAIEEIELPNENSKRVAALQERAEKATLLVVTSPEFLIQR